LTAGTKSREIAQLIELYWLLPKGRESCRQKSARAGTEYNQPMGTPVTAARYRRESANYSVSGEGGVTVFNLFRRKPRIVPFYRPPEAMSKDEQGEE
jgi:hypothetical protein